MTGRTDRSPRQVVAPSSAGLAILLALALALAAGAAPPLRAQIRLTNVTDRSGVDFVHTDGSSGRRYIVETVASGLALFDYDGDGDIDIYLLNGGALPGTRFARPPRNALWRNEGGWRFTDVTELAGVGDTGHGLGVAVADYDGDGDRDIHVNNFGPNVLYRNNGDGTFTDVTREAGVGGGQRVGAGAAFLDIEGDGDLDLYVSNYVDFTFENHVTCRFNGHPAYVGPMNYSPTPDTLYRNDGDGTFTDVSVASGVAGHPGTGMGMVCADFDRDGDTDVFVGNDVAGNSFFLNDGRGRFEEAGLLTGVAYDFRGTAQGTMGVECGDYDGDGWLDALATSYQQDTATLYRNSGEGFFEDVTRVTGAGRGTYRHVTWGNALVDLDNDGDRDIFIACGHLHDNVRLFDSSTVYRARNMVLRNDGGRFVDVSSGCGDGLLAEGSTRGVAFDDLDGDGDLDGVLLESRQRPVLLRNDSPPAHWLRVRLLGARRNRDGVGAQVFVRAGGATQVAEVHSGRGYQSHFGLCLHFGLGTAARAESVTVRWIGGRVDTVRDVAADRTVRIAEGRGLISP